jgi:tetratricopeptide (TPR) repeat protein
VLQEVADAARNTNAPPPAASVTEFSRWQADALRFSESVATLEPFGAARGWLALFDRFDALEIGPQDRVAKRGQAGMPQSILLGNLPPPPAWPALAQAIKERPAPDSLKARREIGLRMLGAALTADQADLARQVRDLESMLLKADSRAARDLLQICRSIDDAMLDLSDDPEAILAGAERKLIAAERAGDRSYRGVAIPDLVALIGEEKAAPILKRALVSKASTIEFEGASTLALARKLALVHVEDLQIPRWELAVDIGAYELYEALDKKFSQTGAAKAESIDDALAGLEFSRVASEGRKGEASTYYLMSLIARGRVEEAARFAEHAASDSTKFRLASSAVTSLERAGYVRAIDDFLHELLSRNAKLPFWNIYFRAAAKAGTTDRMLTLARTVAADPNSANVRSIRNNLVTALLAADKVDEAISELRILIGSNQGKARAASIGDMEFADEDSIAGEAPSLLLAHLGVLFDRGEWLDEGLKSWSKEPTTSTSRNYMAEVNESRRMALLRAAGRFAEYEREIVAQLVQLKRAPSGSGVAAYFSPHPSQAALALLLGLYHDTGRHADVIALLEKSPDWGHADLAGLGRSRYGSPSTIAEDLGGRRHLVAGHVGRIPIATTAASALMQAGRRVEARRITEYLLEQTPEDDRVYELLVALDGNDAIPRLDRIFAEDPFQERPLIWKAQLLLKAERLEEAEKVARQAVAIDPSDGEQGKGDRMRVYAVLADIREARGDAKEGGILRGALRAIRLSERADDFFAAGLLTRAVAMYQESLQQFTDAYCIQSRLAVQLSDLGQHELAAVHYQKAFELMPDSFGRIESHCFGCERTFDSAPAQTVAERVFTRLVQENPKKPQVHYLLGYLRKQQGQGKESVPHFRRAVQLDPDYLNAWVRLREIAREYRLPATERDEIAFQIHRLDPRRRHADPGLETVGDLVRLWNATAKPLPKKQRPTELMALPASREAVEKRKAAGSRDDIYGWNQDESDDEELGVQGPHSALASQKLVAAISLLLMSADDY